MFNLSLIRYTAWRMKWKHFHKKQQTCLCDDNSIFVIGQKYMSKTSDSGLPAIPDRSKTFSLLVLWTIRIFINRSHDVWGTVCKDFCLGEQLFVYKNPCYNIWVGSRIEWFKSIQMVTRNFDQLNIYSIS